MKTRFFGGALTLWYLFVAIWHALHLSGPKNKTSDDLAGIPKGVPVLKLVK